MDVSEFFQPSPPDAPPEPIPALVTSSARMMGPGPGAYQTRTDISQIPKITIHRRLEDKLFVNDAPYSNIPSCIGQGKKWSFKGRPQESIEPGIGPDYMPKAFGSDVPAQTFGRRINVNVVNDTPGPGEYKISSPFGDPSKGASFHGPNERSLNRHSLDTPGPAAYSPKLPSTSKRGYMGRRVYYEKTDETPGPGSYKTPQAISPNRDKGYLGKRIDAKMEGFGPGPGAYNLDQSIIHRTPRITMKGRTGLTVETNQAGYHNIRGSSDMPKYSLRSRINIENSDSTPGPCYIPAAFGKDAAKPSISPRLKPLRLAEIGPGPGEYTVGSYFGKYAQKSTFHGPRERTITKGSDGPSPAEYYPDYRAVKGGPKGISIGRRINMDRNDQSAPYYNIPSTLRGPSYTMRSRPKLDVAYV